MPLFAAVLAALASATVPTSSVLLARGGSEVSAAAGDAQQAFRFAKEAAVDVASDHVADAKSATEKAWHFANKLKAASGDNVDKAKEASKKSWGFAKAVQAASKDSLDLATKVKAAAEAAKVAAEKAKAEDTKMGELYNQEKANLFKAAKDAALEYFQEVKKAGADNASASMVAADTTAPQEAQVAIAKAAIEAALPFNAERLRGQKRILDYQRKAQALYAAGNNLQIEGSRLAPNAEQYQVVGEMGKASQIIMTAKALMEQGANMKRAAETFHATADQLNKALPSYVAAEKAAIAHASNIATGAVLPTLQPPI